MLFLSNKKVKKMTFQLFWLVALTANFCVFNLEAQSNKSEKVVFDTCETMVERLGFVINDFQKNATPNSYLVIIGGNMKGEKASYNNRRIQESIGYLDFYKKIKRERIVFGIGMPEIEAGYLRFYINGTFSTDIRTRKNAKLCFGDGTEFKFKAN